MSEPIQIPTIYLIMNQKIHFTVKRSSSEPAIDPRLAKYMADFWFDNSINTSKKVVLKLAL